MTNDFAAGLLAGIALMATLVAMFQIGLNRGFDLAITILNKDKAELLQQKSRILLYPVAQDKVER